MSQTTVKPETIGIQELAIALAEAHDFTKAKGKLMVDSLRDEIIQTLLSGKRVNIYGLGIFEVKDTKPKVGRNPKTGETINIPAGRKLTFKVAKPLKEQL